MTSPSLSSDQVKASARLQSLNKRLGIFYLIPDVRAAVSNLRQDFLPADANHDVKRDAIDVLEDISSHPDQAISFGDGYTAKKVTWDILDWTKVWADFDQVDQEITKAREVIRKSLVESDQVSGSDEETKEIDVWEQYMLDRTKEGYDFSQNNDRKYEYNHSQPTMWEVLVDLISMTFTILTQMGIIMVILCLIICYSS